MDVEAPLLPKQPLASLEHSAAWVCTGRQTMFSDAVFSIIATLAIVTVEIERDELKEVGLFSCSFLYHFVVCTVYRSRSLDSMIRVNYFPPMAS